MFHVSAEFQPFQALVYRSMAGHASMTSPFNLSWLTQDSIWGGFRVREHLHKCHSLDVINQGLTRRHVTLTAQTVRGTLGITVHHSRMKCKLNKILLQGKPPSFVRDVTFSGSPEQCAEKIGSFLDAGASYFVLDFQFHGLASVDYAIEQMSLFANEVIPSL